MMSSQDYLTNIRPVWCPGCGDYGVLAAFMEAVSELQLKTENLAVISGIGCSSRFPFYVKSYGFHGVHGRALPVAQGVKLANPKLDVVVITGDGDALAIGGGHLPHLARNNTNVTCILFNNAIYGLTKGQVSPATQDLDITKTTPYGLMWGDINPAALAISYDASFVARGFAVEKVQLKEMIKAGIEHKGFALIEVLTSCASFNTIDKNVAKIKQKHQYVPDDVDKTDKCRALALADSQDPIYLGILRQVKKPCLVERMDEATKEARADKLTVAGLLEKY